MKTKEAIEFLEEEVEYRFAGDYDISLSEVKEFRDSKQKVIELLEEGGRYKKMWEEVFHYSWESFHEVDILNKIKDKYFPEEVKTIE